MPPLTQRRNRAYLNPSIVRPAASNGLAIDLGGSLEQRLRRDAVAGGLLVPPRRLSAAEPKGWNWRQAQS